MRRRVHRTTHALGRGLVAGLVGTAAVTLAGGGARAASQRPDRLVPWAYGTALGGVRGLLDATGLGRNLADVAFHGVAFGAEQVLVPVLGLATPIGRRDRTEIASDVARHTVYALATNGAYRWLAPRG